MPSTTTLFLGLLYVSQFYNGLVQAHLQVHSAAYCSDRDGENSIFADALKCGDDSFMVDVRNGMLYYSGVFDGAINSKAISVGLAGYCKQVAKDAKNLNSTSVLLSAQQKMKSNPFLGGETTALTLGLDLATGKLHATNYGSSEFVVIRNGKVVQRLNELTTFWKSLDSIRYRSDIITVNEKDSVYTLDLNPKDIIVLATDGLWDNLFHEDIIAISQESLNTANKYIDDFPKAFAKKLVERSQMLGKRKNYTSPVTKKKIQWLKSIYSDPEEENAKYSLSRVQHEGKWDDITVVALYIRDDSKQKTEQKPEPKKSDYPKVQKMEPGNKPKKSDEPKSLKSEQRKESKKSEASETKEIGKSLTYCYQGHNDPQLQNCYRFQQNIRCFTVKMLGQEETQCEEDRLKVLNHLYGQFLNSFKHAHNGKETTIKKSKLDVPKQQQGKPLVYIDYKYKEVGVKYYKIQQMVECFNWKHNVIEGYKCNAKTLNLLDSEYEEFLSLKNSELIRGKLVKTNRSLD